PSARGARSSPSSSTDPHPSHPPARPVTSASSTGRASSRSPKFDTGGETLSALPTLVGATAPAGGMAAAVAMPTGPLAARPPREREVSMRTRNEEAHTSAVEARPVARDRLSVIGALAAGGAALAVGALARTARAGNDDVGTLNGLLLAEYGAIAAYSAGAGILMSPPANDALASAAPVVLAVAVHFQ